MRGKNRQNSKNASALREQFCQFQALCENKGIIPAKLLFRDFPMHGIWALSYVKDDRYPRMMNISEQKMTPENPYKPHTGLSNPQDGAFFNSLSETAGAQKRDPDIPLQEMQFTYEKRKTD